MRGPTLTLMLLAVLAAIPAIAGIPNGGFENGSFAGWIADPNWVVVDNSRGIYTGWAGKYWAWSGGKGEAATGVLKSKPFVLDKEAVRLLISGWSSIRGTGMPRKWDYVTLNLADGTEIDRVYSPDATNFVAVYLDGSKYKGRKVYIQAVDDADQATFSMLCIDDVRTADMPSSYSEPVAIPAFDSTESIKLEDENCLVEVSRSNGSVTRIRDKKTSLDLILEPRLAGSYKFALQIPGKEPWQTIEANWIFGRDQKLSSCVIGADKLVLQWDSPVSNYLRAKFKASVTETIRLTGGGVLFDLTIDNPTAYPVGEVYFPIIGGIQGLGKTYGQLKTTTLVRPAAGDASATADIFRVFANMSWLGDQGPEQYYAYPEGQPEPWVGFASKKAGRSVYIGARDPSDRKKYIRMELVPASSGTTREDGNWPRPEELKGLPVGVELSFVDEANLPGHKTYHAAPVFLRFLDGAGPEMRKAYAEWKATK
jgi:hypothetical protein